MSARLIYRLLALVCLGAGCAMAQTSVPDTPAGHTLKAWLDAFNSGDRAKIETYVKTVDQKQNVEGMMSFRSQNWHAARAAIDICRKAGDGFGLGDLYDIYVERIEGFRRNPPPADWTGVFAYDTK